jgi:transcriptional regulator with XRE-family HTH domain
VNIFHLAKKILVMRTTGLNNALKRIGAALSKLREKRGYNSIKEFAEDHNLSLIQYWRIEKGKANITIKTLTNLLAIHKIAINDFFCMLL